MFDAPSPASLPAANRTPLARWLADATTPGLLRRCGLLLVLLSVLAAGMSLWAAASIGTTVRTIGQDAEPSVGLALRMADTLATLDAAALGDSLTDGGATVGTSAAFRAAIRSLPPDLVEAARNVTYGEAEAGPLRAITRWTIAYQEAIAEARALGRGEAPGDPWITIQRVRWASRLNRDFAAPEAAALAKVNADVLEQQYASYRSSSLLLGGAAFGAFVLLVMALAGVQWWIARRMRRLVNPALATATLIAAAAGAWFGVAVLTERADLRAAKNDAYDSLYVLFEAKGAASALRAAMSMWMLDPATRDASQAEMDGAAQRLIGVNVANPAQAAPTIRVLQQALALEQDGKTAEALVKGSHLGGLLGTELDNITFGVEEREPATRSVERLADALSLVQATQALEARRDRANAVGRWLGRGAGQGEAVFAQLQAALDQTVAVNQAAFDRRVSRALNTAALMPFAAVGALLATLLLALGGLWQRMREYR